MYNDEVLQIPANEDEFWEKAREQFEHARTILWETPVETKEDALKGTYRKPGKGSPMAMIRYRDTSTKYDNRDFYLKLGASLLPYIDQAIDEKQMTLEFVHQWGKFMFCHGYLASYYFEDSDDLALQRAGAVKIRDAQRKWVAYLIRDLQSRGATRHQAEVEILKHIKQILTLFRTDPAGAKRQFGKFDAGWFRSILSGHREDAVELGAIYRQNKFYERLLQQSIAEHPNLEIPSTKLVYP